jgi:hypothetical protein
MKISRALLYFTLAILGITGVLAGIGYLFIMGSIVVYSVLPILWGILLYAMIRVTMRYRAELLGKAYLLTTILLFVVSIAGPGYFLYRFPENDSHYLAEGGEYKEKNGDKIKYEIYNYRNHKMAYKRYWKLTSEGKWQKYGSWEFYDPNGKMTIYEEYDANGKLRIFPKKEEKK